MKYNFKLKPGASLGLFKQPGKVDTSPNVRTGDYIVEVIKPGRKRGNMKVFRNIKSARQYAREEYKKGNAVAIDKMLKYGQRPIVSKGMGRTKIGKDWDFGKL